MSIFNQPLADAVGAVVSLGLGAAGHILWGTVKRYLRDHRVQIENAAIDLIENVVKDEVAAAQHPRVVQAVQEAAQEPGKAAVVPVPAPTPEAAPAPSPAPDAAQNTAPTQEGSQA